MRLYGAITKVEPQDDGTIKVHGIASSEAVDDQGEIVRATAMRAAIPEYMRFPALREMHQLSAAGTTLEAEVGDDGITRIVAHVVDAAAVSKVKHKVYRGFSIGGRVTKRDSTNPKDILGVTLNEISLVDRPANPEAVFDVWKAVATMSDPFNPPMQVWTCPYPDHKHTSKSTAAKCVDQYNTQVATKAASGADAAQAEVDEALADLQGSLDVAKAAAYNAAISALLAWAPATITQGGKPSNYGDLLPLVEKANAAFQEMR